MKKIKLSTKELDAISCMIEYFFNNNNGFITRYHKRITQRELKQLQNKLT